jgi:hypothetical protein
MRKVPLIPIMLLAFGACDAALTDPTDISGPVPATLVVPDGAVQVKVDIQPNSENTGNVVNVGTPSFVTVAILAEPVEADGEPFDVTTVVISSVRFGPEGVEASPLHVFTVDGPGDHFRDTDGDGEPDVLLLHFDKAEAGLDALGPGTVTLFVMADTQLSEDTPGPSVWGGEEVKLVINQKQQGKQ